MTTRFFLWGNIIKLGLDPKFSETSAAFDVQGLVLLRFYPPALLHTALVKSEVYLETAADSWTDLSGHLELINERKTDVNTHTQPPYIMTSTIELLQREISGRTLPAVWM